MGIDSRLLYIFFSPRLLPLILAHLSCQRQLLRHRWTPGRPPHQKIVRLWETEIMSAHQVFSALKPQSKRGAASAASEPVVGRRIARRRLSWGCRPQRTRRRSFTRLCVTFLDDAAPLDGVGLEAGRRRRGSWRWRRGRWRGPLLHGLFNLPAMQRLRRSCRLLWW